MCTVDFIYDSIHVDKPEHHELMRKLYAEYADSMGRLTTHRVEIIDE